MMIPVARLYRLALLAAVGFLALAAFQTLSAQPTEEDKEVVRLNRRIASLISSIDEIKWSNITIYKLESEFSARLSKNMEAEDKADIDYVESIGQTVGPEPIPDFAQKVMTIAGSGAGNQYASFKVKFAQGQSIDPEDLDDAQLQQAYSRIKAVINKRKNRPKDFYLVTSREKNPPRLIALLGVTEDGGNITITKPWTGTELYSYLRTNSPDTTMYTELKQTVAEGGSGLVNQMFVLRNLEEIVLAPQTKARATYLDENQYMYVLTGVSEGRPVRGEAKVTVDTTEGTGTEGASLFGEQSSNLFGGTGGKDMKNKVKGAQTPGTNEYPYELTVGTDVLVAFHAYDVRSTPTPTSKWGIELRNNFDELNYPSIWGGRLTLNAILENVRIGAVMPEFRFGDSTIATSGIGSRQQKILGGWGVAFGGDFTAPLLDNSGLFNFYASYTFGEAKTDKMGLSSYNLVTGERLSGEDGYLIRFAFQGYYSFGFYADAAATHLFRLKLGGTTYGVDTYILENDTTAANETVVLPTKLTKRNSQTIGGVSAKLEYMHSGITYPYGASLQYVDQSLLSDVWLQFIVARNLDFKVDLKYFTPFARDPHPWENPNLVVPAVSMKYHFGG